MFFTQEDYKKILTWLNQNAIKDSEFKEASLPLNEYDIISFVLNGNNVKVRLKDFLELLFLLREFSDFINITDKYKAKYIVLKQAILLVPYKTRKIGQVITFLNEEKEWKIYQFKGESVNQWNEESLWEDIVKAIQGSDLVADEEDLTEVVDEVSGKSLLKLKDKTYDPDNFSGLGRVILRKNIVTVLNPDTLEGLDINLLTLLMINKPNTIYEIQYDFDLNNLEITIPEGCVLDFKGGSLNNGVLNGNNTRIKSELYKIFNNITFNGNYIIKEVYSEWYGAVGDGKVDDSDSIQLAIDSGLSNNLCLIGKYGISKTINLNKNVKLYGAGINININPIILKLNNFTGDCLLFDTKNNTISNISFTQAGNVDIIHSSGSLRAYNCDFSSGLNGIRYIGDGTVNVIIDKCRFSYQKDNGILFDNSTSYNTTNIITNNYFNSCGSPNGNFNPNAKPAPFGNGNGIYSKVTQSNIRITNNTFEYCYGFGILLETTLQSAGNKNAVVLGNYFEGNRNAAFYLNLYNSQGSIIYSNFCSYPYNFSSESYVAKYGSYFIVNYLTHNYKFKTLEQSFIDNINKFINIDKIIIDLDMSNWDNIKEHISDIKYYTVEDNKKCITTINNIYSNTIYIKSPCFIKIDIEYKVKSGEFGIYQVYKNNIEGDRNPGYGKIFTLLVNNQWNNINQIIPCYYSDSLKTPFVSIISLTNKQGELFISKYKIEIINYPIIDINDYNLCKSMTGVQVINKSNNDLYTWINDKWIDSNGNPINSLKQGTTQQRPTDVKAGFYYFDTTLNMPIWKKDDTTNVWIDAMGAEV